jgi:hypothetical protein
MPEAIEVHESIQQKTPVAVFASLAVLLVLLLVALYLVVDLRGRVATLESANLKQDAVNKVLEDKLHLTNKNMEAGMEALGSKVGMTEEELAKRTSELRVQQERAAARLSAEQQATNKQVASVSSNLSGVQTELGGAKTDIATTRTDLAATKAKLEATIGDLNVHSGLIAKNHDELEFLKHKGDRNYFEFTLKKKARSPISTVSLELRSTTPKKSRFTLNVYADDHTIEKKDRTLGEPLQFYTGRDKSLYEVVIFTVGKDEITGYLSTPK